MRKGFHSKECYSLSGFTLIEMVITLSIISLVLSLSVWTFQNVKNNAQLESATRILKSDIVTSQGLSMSENKRYYFRFYPQYYEFYPEDKVEINKRKLPPSIKIIKTTFNKKDPGKDIMFFYPSGYPSSAGTIYLQAQNGKVLKVVVSLKNWGRVRIEKE